jgi:hypothetical protein
MVELKGSLLRVRASDGPKVSQDLDELLGVIRYHVQRVLVESAGAPGVVLAELRD